MDAIGLRMGLLLIGVLVVAGIYLAGTLKGRHRAKQARRLKSRTGARREAGTDALSLESDADGAAFQGLAPLVKDDGTPAAVPSMHRDPDKRTAQMEFPFEDSDGEGPETEILVINIESPETPIPGNDLVNAVTDAGMRYGDMQIFHHYGLGQRAEGTPVFSLANLYEPGTFDIQRMDMFSTRGVAMFLQLPAPGMDGEVACELFVGTAERIAGRLACRLYNQSHQELAAHDLEIMRRQARRFAAAR